MGRDNTTYRFLPIIVKGEYRCLFIVIHSSNKHILSSYCVCVLTVEEEHDLTPVETDILKEDLQSFWNCFKILITFLNLKKFDEQGK